MVLSVGAVVVDIRFRHDLNPSDEPNWIFRARTGKISTHRNPKDAMCCPILLSVA
jgi:hypothetical protein